MAVMEVEVEMEEVVVVQVLCIRTSLFPKKGEIDQ